MGTVRMSNRRLAMVAATCLAVFAAASLVASSAYAEWMWAFVFGGLVLPPVVLVLAVAMSSVERLSRPRSTRRP